MEKSEIISKFKSKIETGLKDGKIKEKLTSKAFTCASCVFCMECLRVYSLPCMAHNRAKRDSIYYGKK